MGSFNSFAQMKATAEGCSVPVWLGTVAPMPVGGVLASAFCIEGALIPAGTPINLTNGVIKPFIAWEVVSAASAAKTVTVKANELGFVPSVNDILGACSTSNIDAAAKASKVASVAPGENEGEYVITFADANIPGVATAGQYIVYSNNAAAATSGATNVKPNAYLYNDICIEKAPAYATEANLSASGAAVAAHNEGLLINRTPGAAFKEMLAAAIPNVILIEY